MEESRYDIKIILISHKDLNWAEKRGKGKRLPRTHTLIKLECEDSVGATEMWEPIPNVCLEKQGHPCKKWGRGGTGGGGG